MEDETRVTETADRMLSRYSTARTARDMANFHECDSAEPAFWRAVRIEIERRIATGKVR
jgi:hypothetical protein